MNASKPLPIVAALLGLAAIIGAAVTLSNSGTSSLEKQVDEFFAQEQEPERLHDPEKKMDQLASLQNDPAFGKLPQTKQEAVRDRFRELSAFQDFQKRLNAIPNPKEVRNLSQLRQILSQLEELKVPEEFRAEWSRTETVRRHDDWLEDAKTLERAANEVRNQLQNLTRAGKQVIDNPDAVDLPGRAKAVLDKAKKLSLPERDPYRMVPGSPRATYTMVLQIAEVKAAYQEWKKIRAKLASVSESETRHPRKDAKEQQK